MLIKYPHTLERFIDDVVSVNNSLWRQVDDFLGFSPSHMSLGQVVEMQEDLKNNKIKYLLDVPGIKKDNLSITQQGNYIHITGERVGRSQKSYISAQFAMSAKANPESIQVNLSDGVLSVEFDIKKLEQPEPKKIEIQSVSKE